MQLVINAKIMPMKRDLAVGVFDMLSEVILISRFCEDAYNFRLLNAN